MRDRDTQSFDDFYRAAAPRVVHLVYATTGDLTLAQDATQEAFAKAWSDWTRVSTHDDPTAWVRTVARRIAISQWRRGKARDRAYTRHGATATQAQPDENRVAVVAALRQLSPALRETVALHYLGDRSIEQIAAELGVPAGTVKARLHRGRAQLADLLRSGPAAPSGAATTTARMPSPQRKEARHG
ncbi:RNA polymerase sigma24 factor [Knoellia sinensis KCTC 19936]|uniref:RNA polymerase sigma24 factor n=1 Tax=Knoellia sinensis KCTC 19936 TaxID=1385520 RepID=A0A0A0J6D3_9MICO|nr:SigE family RNA polymerase sigma factor [Knoellia sinensis]KGN32905.1 RNA polymerase sigma24 factor [Knoellia sinensis KCTC 19936]